MTPLPQTPTNLYFNFNHERCRKIISNLFSFSAAQRVVLNRRRSIFPFPCTFSRCSSFGSTNLFLSCEQSETLSYRSPRQSAFDNWSVAGGRNKLRTSTSLRCSLVSSGKTWSFSFFFFEASCNPPENLKFRCTSTVWSFWGGKSMENGNASDSNGCHPEIWYQLARFIGTVERAISMFPTPTRKTNHECMKTSVMEMKDNNLRDRKGNCEASSGDIN